MKRTLVSIAVLFTVGCGGGQLTLTADEARSALPTSAQAQVGTPDAGSASSVTALLDTPQAAAAPVTAPYAADTIALAAAVNGGVGWTLGIVSWVVDNLPPTACAGDTCTWGPGSGALEVNEWLLTVTKKAAANYVWSLQGRPKSSPGAAWSSFLSGEAFTTGVRHVGHGTLTIDFDAAASLARKTTDPEPQAGKMLAAYDNTAGRHVSVQFLGTRDANDAQQRVNVAYDFVATAAGGDLQLATHNLSTDARLALRSRWTGTGAGRGDASYTVGTQAYAESQCWDAASTLFNLVYRATQGTVITGTEAACGAFIPAAAPTITAP